MTDSPAWIPSSASKSSFWSRCRQRGFLVLDGIETLALDVQRIPFNTHAFGVLRQILVELLKCQCEFPVIPRHLDAIGSRDGGVDEDRSQFRLSLVLRGIQPELRKTVHRLVPFCRVGRTVHVAVERIHAGRAEHLHQLHSLFPALLLLGHVHLHGVQLALLARLLPLGKRVAEVRYLDAEGNAVVGHLPKPSGSGREPHGIAAHCLTDEVGCRVQAAHHGIRAADIA